MKKISYKKIVFSFAICYSAALVGGLFGVKSSNGWYETIAKPSFTPPDWIFGPVWMFLYSAMAVALYLVLIKKQANRSKSLAIFLFYVQLAFNAMWSVLFFYLHSPILAFADIVILCSLLSIVTFLFARISVFSALLMSLYLLWTLFASVLNFFIWQMN